MLRDILPSMEVALTGRPRSRCSICSNPDMKTLIDAQLAVGTPYLRIAAATKEAGRSYKRATISAHASQCLKGQRPVLNEAAVESVKTDPTVPQEQKDLAAAVQQEALRQLRAGNLRISVKDGLTAQALLDKRAEKEKDRGFMLNLARLLSGAGGAAPDEVVEGTFTEVDDMRLLAPPELVTE